jgi:mitochondrial translocator assembly and maintenance protein 41
MPEARGLEAMGDGAENLDAELEDIVALLPPAPFAFAYGSAVFPQVGVSRPDRMLDFILAVESPRAWHADNMARNPAHYAAPFRVLGPAAASRVQQSSFGARVFYNTLLAPQQRDRSHRSFKYGVIALEDLARDLRAWESLYVAGRMHKPIQVLTPGPPPPGIAQAAERNIAAATSAALLTLPARFAERDLYLAAARLSYAGDIRETFRAEVADKVQNIVRANLSRFRGLYHSALCDLPVSRSSSGIWERQMGQSGQLDLIQRLPQRVVERVSHALGVHHDDRSELTNALSERSSIQLRSALLTTISAIVFRASLNQSVKGLLTAGLGTSVRYVVSKFSKALSARRRVLPSAKGISRETMRANSPMPKTRMHA